MKPLKSELQICDFLSSVHLGCTEAEQANPQKVLFSVRVKFLDTPRGTKTDDINDTVCYAWVCEEIQRICALKPYHLIEHLGDRVFTAIKERVASQGEVQVCTHKVHPPVPQLTGGTKYITGDLVD